MCCVLWHVTAGWYFSRCILLLLLFQLFDGWQTATCLAVMLNNNINVQLKLKYNELCHSAADGSIHQFSFFNITFITHVKKVFS